MTIEYKLDEDGGFTCGNTETGLTSYAFPTSVHATAARKNPAYVARAMLRGEELTLSATKATRADFDERQWKKLRLSVPVGG